MTKLCRDCKWMVEPGELAKCNAPLNYAPYLTGFEKYPRNFTYCSTQRSAGWLYSWLTDSTCGKTGRWFVAKEETE